MKKGPVCQQLLFFINLQRFGNDKDMGKTREYNLFTISAKTKNTFYEPLFVKMCIDENFNAHSIFFDNVADTLTGTSNFKWI